MKQIEIEWSEQEYELLEELAAEHNTTPDRIARLLITKSAEDLLEESNTKNEPIFETFRRRFDY
jgi:hypothetical protein